MHSKNAFGRRSLMKGIAGAGLATGLIGFDRARAAPGNGLQLGNLGAELPSVLQAPPRLTAAPGSDGFWNQVKKTFIVGSLDNYIHMNTGTTGSQPFFVLSNLAVYNLYKSLDPRDWNTNLAAAFPDLFKLVNNNALTARQNAIASVYGAQPGEICISYDTTDAANLIFAGTPWNPGDRIITTSFEHPAFAGPLAWVRDYMGVEVVVIPMQSNWTVGVPELLSWFETELAKPLPVGAKQYVATCEIFYKNGARMPVKEICSLARKYGAYSMIDTAHGWGMIPVNCADYGADFLCGAGHKWLCAGPGTGIFYMRQTGSNLPPFNGGNWGGYGNLFVKPSAKYNNRAAVTAASINGRGETNTPALYAVADAVQYYSQIGLQAIYERGTGLARYLQDKVIARWGLGALSVQNLTEPTYKTFLTGVNPFKAKNDASAFATMNTAINEVLAALAAGTPKVYIRSITWHSEGNTGSADDRVAFRISTHAVYNNKDQIDIMFNRLVEEVNKVSTKYNLPQA